MVVAIMVVVIFDAVVVIPGFEFGLVFVVDGVVVEMAGEVAVVVVMLVVVVGTVVVLGCATLVIIVLIFVMVG